MSDAQRFDVQINRATAIVESCRDSDIHALVVLMTEDKQIHVISNFKGKSFPMMMPDQTPTSVPVAQFVAAIFAKTHPEIQS